jgi:hypothetical protein
MLIEQLSDPEQVVDVLPAIVALPRRGPHRPDYLKFRFPITQDVGINPNNLTDFTDL